MGIGNEEQGENQVTAEGNLEQGKTDGSCCYAGVE